MVLTAIGLPKVIHNPGTLSFKIKNVWHLGRKNRKIGSSKSLRTQPHRGYDAQKMTKLGDTPLVFVGFSMVLQDFDQTSAPKFLKIYHSWRPLDFINGRGSGMSPKNRLTAAATFDHRASGTTLLVGRKGEKRYT